MLFVVVVFDDIEVSLGFEADLLLYFDCNASRYVRWVPAKPCRGTKTLDLVGVWAAGFTIGRK